MVNYSSKYKIKNNNLAFRTNFRTNAIQGQFYAVPDNFKLFVLSFGQRVHNKTTYAHSTDVAAFYWPAYHSAERFREIPVFPDGAVGSKCPGVFKKIQWNIYP